MPWNFNISKKKYLGLFSIAMDQNALVRDYECKACWKYELMRRTTGPLKVEYDELIRLLEHSNGCSNNGRDIGRWYKSTYGSSRLALPIPSSMMDDADTRC